MNQRWTLHIENFARINSADVEISPLMCFIGDNNSGKSYVMNLLWGIVASGQKFLHEVYRKNFEPTSVYFGCTDWLEKNMGKTVIMTDEIEQIHIEWLNELIAQHKDDLLKNIFNHEMTAGKIEIRNFSRRKKLSVHVWDTDEEKFPTNTFDNDTVLIEIRRKAIPIEIGNLILCWHLLMENLTDINKSIVGKELPIYLPASRTGLLLVHKLIASKAAVNLLSANPVENFQETLTAPYVQFLDMLINLKNTAEVKDNVKISLIEFLRNKIIHGDITVREDGRTIRYLPEDSETELPMSITSSVVTEIASLLLLLTTRFPLRLIIIEEPEAHLHPALQKKIAQLLIRFVHSGIPIWITTHSDTILQHFNNMINLDNRSAEEREKLLKEFEYSEEDLLTPTEISLYQFEREDNYTSIQKLESGKYGFVGNLFNKAIDELVAEIYAFQEEE